MRNGVISFVAAVLVVATMGYAQSAEPAAATGSKSIPRTADGKPDLSGIWKTITYKVDPLLPTAWGLKQFNYNKLPDVNGARPDLDPLLHCYRPGLTRIGPPLMVPDATVVVRSEGESVPAQGGAAAIDAVQIINTSGKLLLLYQYNQEVRQVFTDGRKHPEVIPDQIDVTKWWNGFSTGTWAGDTFVVDTTNLRNEVWLDNLGHETRESHVIERIRRLDANTLQIDRTITDPVALAKPYSTSATLRLMPELVFQENVVCGQYYVRKLAFGYEGILGISGHSWQGKD